jgi:hypothetical protein
MRFRVPALIALVGLLLVAASNGAWAQNLVFNPGFETGDFTGWTITGDNASVETGVGHTGNFAASFGALSPATDVLSQTLATEVGERYRITFFAQTPELGVPPGSPNSLAVSFEGLQIDSFTVPDNVDYNQFSYTVTAHSTSSDLSFAVSNDPDFTQLDDVSVTRIVATGPEPGALPLLITGASAAGLLVLWSRRRRGTPIA